MTAARLAVLLIQTAHSKEMMEQRFRAVDNATNETSKRTLGMNSSHYSHFIAVTVKGEQNSVVLLKIHPQGKFCT